jgi:MFS family permease
MPRRRGLLRTSREFRLLWSGQTVSQFGTQVSYLALPLVAVKVLHASTFEVGLLTTAAFAAFLLIGLPAGAWVDRMRRRPVLVAADAGRALLMGSIPVAAALGHLTMAQLYIVALLAGVLTVFFDVAYQSYLPALVGRDELVAGNALLETSRSAAQVAGPGAGGALVQALTAPYAIVLDAVSFLLSALSITRIRAVEPPVEPPASAPSLRREIGEGLRLVFGHPILRGLAGSVATANFFTAASDAVIIVFLARDLALSAGVIGVVFTLSAVGSLIGALVTRWVSDRIGTARSIWLVPVLTYPFWLLLPLANRSFGLVLFCIGCIVSFGGVVIFNVNAVAFRQTICPPRLLGRMNASMRFVVWGTMPIGGAFGGWLGSLIGTRATMWACGIGLVLSVPFLVLSPLRGMRDLPSGPEAADAHQPAAVEPASTLVGWTPAAAEPVGQVE